ncbi:hypothetical protein ACFVIM_16230 [Streptomyces sp. NPDC057638]|uniref:hypothetical protein n=1 Tax=Streptomyces sp. NPDC057638 TaxID=3346190 RepID=UPI0036AABB9F
MEIWAEHPARADVEAVVRRYFDLLKAGRIPEAGRLVDHTPVRHVLNALWRGSVGAGADEDGTDRALAPGQGEQDVSWLGELHLADFHWGDGDSGVYVETTYRAQVIEVSLSFWIKPTDSGWVLSGPATLW